MCASRARARSQSRSSVARRSMAGGQLAAPHVDVELRQARQVRGRDAHHIGAVRRQARDRTPGPAMTRVRSSTRMPESGRSAPRGSGRGWSIADPGDLEQRQPRHRLALRMRGPLGRRAHHGGDQPGLGGRRLEFLALPFHQRRLHRLALVVAAQQLQHAVAMMRKVGVQAHRAAVARTIDAGDLVPRRIRAACRRCACSARCGTRRPHGACRRQRSACAWRAAARSQSRRGRRRQSWLAPQCRRERTTATLDRRRSTATRSSAAGSPPAASQSTCRTCEGEALVSVICAPAPWRHQPSTRPAGMRLARRFRGLPALTACLPSP